jgi:hypothetical protein
MVLNLSHQAKSNTWQQSLTIHPNSNRGTHLDQGFGSLIGDNFLKSIGIGCIISPNLSLIASPLPVTKNASSGLL